ncbi:hypothetical protein [Streptomyces sp. NPDC003635]
MEQTILFVLAACSVVSAVLFGVKQLLDQLPDMIVSWHRAVAAWRRSGDEPPRPAPEPSGDGGGDSDGQRLAP